MMKEVGAPGALRHQVSPLLMRRVIRERFGPNGENREVSSLPLLATSTVGSC